MTLDPETGDSVPGLAGFDNADAIGATMHRLRSAAVAKSTARHPVMFNVVAFGGVEKRSTFLECIKYALQPTLAHSAYVKAVETQEFEVMVLSTKKVAIEVVEDWLAAFNMSACVIEFQQYMQADMVSCISRIHHLGNAKQTNFAMNVATKVRRDFHKEHNKKLKTMQCQRLLDHTGLHFTPDNMFALSVRNQQQRALIRSLEEQLSEQRIQIEIARRLVMAAEAETLAEAEGMAAQAQAVSM